MKFKKKVLKNGMRVITIPMKDNPAVSVFVLVEAGSKYETKEINGLSHFLEHMVFKGTARRPVASDISREFDSLGSQHNAFTSQEFTGYYAKVHPKHVSKIIDVLSDMYLNPLFEAKEIEKEKGVIVEEINMYEDMPQRHIRDLIMQLVYGDQPAGWSILGPNKNIKAIKREDFINYRKKHYVAKATTVVVSGNFNEKKVLKEISEAFKNISTGRKYPKEKVIEKQNKPKVLVKFKETDQTHMVLGFRAYDIFDKRTPALDLLATILGGGMSSRLFDKLRNQMGVCYYVRAFGDQYTDHGMFGVASGVDNTRVKEVILAILDELKKLKNEIVSEEELKKAKEYSIGNMFLTLEPSDDIAQFYGAQEILRQKIKTPEEMAKELRKVTARDIQKVAKDIFQNKKLNLALIGRFKESREFEQILGV
ncbi:MAG: insulinase family protein [Parcubacteria group bacterium]|nr:insulinase family protein [Parcubacteria group bacterium]